MDYVTFRISGERFAVDLLRVNEVSVLGPVTRVPGAAPAIRGLSSLRGSVIPIVDVSVRLGGRRASVSRRSAVIHASPLVRGAPTAVGLLVDEVEGILRVPPDHVLPPPRGLLAAERGLLRGLACVDGRVVCVLAVDVLADPSRLAGMLSCPGSMEATDAGNAVTIREGNLLPVGGADPSGTATHGERNPPPAQQAPLASPPPPARPSCVRIATRQARVPGGRAGVAGVSGAAPERRARDRAPVGPPRRPGRVAWLVRSAPAAAALLALALAANAWRRGDGELRAAHLHAEPGSGARLLPASPHRPVRTERPAVVRTAPPATPMDGCPAGRQAPPRGVAPASALGEAGDGTCSLPGRTHAVRRGESLWSLSHRYLGNPLLWPRIFAANRSLIEDPDLISPGQCLHVPPRG